MAQRLTLACCMCLNRILFPGGSANIMSSSYQRAAQIFYTLAIEVNTHTHTHTLCGLVGYVVTRLSLCCCLFQANNNGDYFPLWGTCLGFEELAVLTSGRWALTRTNTSAVSLPLNLTTSTYASVWAVHVRVQNPLWVFFFSFFITHCNNSSY